MTLPLSITKTVHNGENFLYLMEQIPGKDGPNGNLTDEFFDSYAVHYFNNADNTPLNAAFYSRFYDTKEKDAMGRNRRRRGFNDAYLWAARTEHKRVSALSVEDPQKVDPNCVGTSCERKSWKREQAWSWAIPLEIVWTTPLSKWNPYNITYLGRSGDKPATGCQGEANTANKNTDQIVLDGGRDGKPNTDGSCNAAKAYACSNNKHFYRTPKTFFGGEDGEQDPADTSGRLTCILDQNGVARKTMASGHWIVFPSIGNVGPVRQRYPIAPIHVAGSTIWKEVKAFEKMSLKDDYDSLLDQDGFFGGQRDGTYGFTLTLMGGGHDHDLRVSGGWHKQWAPMVRSDGYSVATHQVTTVTSNGHQHVIEIERSQPLGSDTPLEYKMLNCKIKGMTEWEVQQDPEHPMCGDGHVSVARVYN